MPTTRTSQFETLIFMNVGFSFGIAMVFILAIWEDKLINPGAWIALVYRITRKRNCSSAFDRYYSRALFFHESRKSVSLILLWRSWGREEMNDFHCFQYKRRSSPESERSTCKQISPASLSMFQLNRRVKSEWFLKTDWYRSMAPSVN